MPQNKHEVARDVIAKSLINEGELALLRLPRGKRRKKRRPQRKTKTATRTSPAVSNTSCKKSTPNVAWQSAAAGDNAQTRRSHATLSRSNPHGNCISGRPGLHRRAFGAGVIRGFPRWGSQFEKTQSHLQESEGLPRLKHHSCELQVVEFNRHRQFGTRGLEVQILSPRPLDDAPELRCVIGLVLLNFMVRSEQTGIGRASSAAAS